MYDFIREQEFCTEEFFDFSKRSSIGCGGRAKICVYPHNIEECCRLLSCLRQSADDYVVVGNLTNVLPSENFQKTLICTKRMTDMKRLENDRIFAESGVLSGNLLAFCQKEKLSGLEFLIGIPCTLGGVLYMNGGVNGRYIAECVESILVYREGKKVILSKEECHYAYKHSLFMETDDVILGATLRLFESNVEEIKSNEEFWLKRRAHLPKGKSMGCVFKNPNGISAGSLIEQAGCKGMRLGGAKVSEIHANFIINEKNATVSDIRTLIELIKKRVLDNSGILLEEEIRYLE